MQTLEAPKTHLTRTESGWTVIHQGMPLLHEKAELMECLKTVATFGLKLHQQVWIAKEGRFGTLAEAKAV